MNSTQYFAAQEATDAASVIMYKIDQWTNLLESNGYLEKLRMCWSCYHGAYYTSSGNGHQITFSGTQGELVNLPVNHLRNIAQHILIMTTSSRPVMEARATNTDYKSLTQTVLANGLLDYYMREKRLERILKNATESAIVLGAGYVKMAWNATSGELYDWNEETNTPIYEGDVEFYNLSPFDVVVDSTKEDQNLDWVICRSWKNRFDLVAKYPELKDKILRLPTKSQQVRFNFNGLGDEDTDDVAVYEFFHRRTESLPDGRYMTMLSDDCVLNDGPMPYRVLPVFRISPGDIMGTPYGYASVFDLVPLQEQYNSLISTIATNQNAFGVQNVLVPRGSDVNVQQLSGGLNVIEYNQAAGKPEPMNLTETPAEVFKFIELIRSEMETLSGINSVARGQAPGEVHSGNALALLQSMAIQFMSGLQESYVELVEDVGTALILMLKDFAAVPRVAAIVGRNNRAYLKEFKGDDLQSINRVICDVGNALSRTTAGRVQMAEQLLQMKAITDPNQYFTVINTGRLDAMTEGLQSELLLIKGENEDMMDGKPVQVLDIDQHKQHIMEHKAILSDPDLRRDPELVQNVLKHIQDHIQALQQSDPNLLQLLDQQPLPPPGPPPGAPGPDQGQPPQGSPMSQPPQNPGSPLPLPPQAAGGPPVNLPHMPKVPASLLVNPALQEQVMNNVNNKR